MKIQMRKHYQDKILLWHQTDCVIVTFFKSGRKKKKSGETLKYEFLVLYEHSRS